MTKRTTFHILGLAAVLAVGGAAVWAKGPDAAAVFSRIDANGDGQLTTAELEAHAAARFARVDSNRDGVLTVDEIAAGRGGDRAEKMLRRFDTDGNGSLDQSELEAAANTRAGKRVQKMMGRIDANGDGQVTLTEMRAQRDPAQMIARLDTDGNGTLSQEEFAKARKR